MPAQRPVQVNVQPAEPPIMLEWDNADVVGREFANIEEVSSFSDARGFVLGGRFVHSQWPAKVVRIQDDTNGIHFHLKGATLLHDYSGQRLHFKTVSLEDNDGGETMVVLRSKYSYSVNSQRVVRPAYPPQPVTPQSLARELSDAGSRGEAVKMNLLLTEHPELVNAANTNNHGMTPLHEAAFQKQTGLIKALLEHGANANARTDDGETPLMMALVRSDNTDVVRLLLAYGADASLKTDSGFTALDSSKARQSPEIMAMLQAQIAQTNDNPRVLTPPK